MSLPKEDFVALHQDTINTDRSACAGIRLVDEEIAMHEVVFDHESQIALTEALKPGLVEED
jgi:hypothetical protein